MTRTNTLIAAGTAVLVILVVWAFFASQQPKPVVVVEAGGASVSIGEGGIEVKVPESN